MVKRKRGVASHFWAHKMHVKMLIWLAQSQCYGIGRKKLIWGCQGSLLKLQINLIDVKWMLFAQRRLWKVLWKKLSLWLLVAQALVWLWVFLALWLQSVRLCAQDVYVSLIGAATFIALLRALVAGERNRETLRWLRAKEVCAKEHRELYKEEHNSQCLRPIYISLSF